MRVTKPDIERSHGENASCHAWVRYAGSASAAALVLWLLAPAAFAYDFNKSITIDRSKISDASCGATLTNYPMLFSVTDPDLAHTTSGGDVTDVGGDDIIFLARDATTCGGPATCVLDHEIEKYVSTTGELVAWVRLPAVNTSVAASDTVLYVYYGDSSVTSPTENPAGVWDANYKGVWHLEEDVTDEATGGVHDDSTSNANDGAQNGNVEGTGRIADGQDFDGTDDYIDVGNVIGAAGTVTLSAWVKHDNVTATKRERYVDLDNVAVIRHDGINSMGQLHFYVRTGGIARSLRVNGVLSNGVWNHVAGTWDGTTQRLFLNGSEVASQVPGGSLDPISAGTINDSDPTETMDGILDEVRISDTARSACWIDAEYDNQFDPGDVGAPGFYTLGAEVARYSYLKPVTIDRTKIDGSCGATMADYPMLFTLTDADLAHTTSGGDVTDLGGDDIVFKAHDDATCGGVGLAPCTLDHEIERYVNTTGELVAWVRIPSLNTAAAGSDTVIYLYYGNTSVTTPTENPNGVWDANYVGVWHLEEPVTDEASGGTHDDSTSNANDGSQTNNGPFAGEIADAQDFDGSGDFITVADDNSLSFGDSTTDSPFSVSAWVFADTATNNIIVAKDASAAGEWDLYIGAGGGELQMILNDVTTSNKLGRRTVAAFPTGSWHHVAVSYDASPPYTSADIKMYIDGAQPATSDYSAGTYVAMHNTTTPVQIGTWDGGGNSYDMNGRIDEVRISSTVRSACWIGASYNNQVWPNKAVTPSPDPSPNPDSGFYTVGAATAVELVSFTARGVNGGVELRWETGSEMDNLGYHLYRGVSEAGPYERITASPIPGLGSSPEGARYRYRDTGLDNGVTYFYELEDIETTGRTERHGPVSGTPLFGGATVEEIRGRWGSVGVGHYVRRAGGERAASAEPRPVSGGSGAHDGGISGVSGGGRLGAHRAFGLRACGRERTSGEADVGGGASGKASGAGVGARAGYRDDRFASGGSERARDRCQW